MNEPKRKYFEVCKGPKVFSCQQRNFMKVQYPIAEAILFEGRCFFILVNQSSTTPNAKIIQKTKRFSRFSEAFNTSTDFLKNTWFSF